MDQPGDPNWEHWKCPTGYHLDRASNGAPQCNCLQDSTNPGTTYGQPTLPPNSYGRNVATPTPGAPIPFPTLSAGCNGGEINTALGCIPVGDTNEFVGWFLKWALGIAGGVAFILMVMAGFQIMTASGNPDKVQGGRELLNAAVSGLVLVIFSIFLLKLIGVDILAIPGF